MKGTGAVKLPSLSLVAADTRLNPVSNGQRMHQDAGTLKAQLEDGSVYENGNRRRKLRRFPWGWTVATGMPGLAELCISELPKNPPISRAAIQTRLQESYQRHVQHVHSKLTVHDPQDEHVWVGYTYFSGGQFRVGAFDSRGPTPEGADFLLSNPPDLPAEEARYANEYLANRLRSPANLPELYGQLRLIATLFHRIHARSTSVSDRTQFGILGLTGPRQIVEWELDATNPEIMVLNDAPIVQRLQRIG